ncbi:MAG: hypothetical protein GFH24_608438n42 [Chloroflexi bacterium AL-N5]|nr:hypothetical protein [Chloroflexi bacterium AL-N5]
MLNVMTTSLKVMLNPPSGLEGFPGETVMLHVSLINQGTQGAVIDVHIDPMGQTWCPSPQQRVALDPQQGCEVSLSFELPIDALPGSYPFTLVVDAPDHYPEETPLHYPSQLEVLIKERPVERLDQPTFILNLATSPDTPLLIQPGQHQTLSVQVNNRSRRVDRFRLNCLDLDPDWFTIQYPCTDLSELGVLSDGDSLELNPGTQGTVTVEFYFPLDMPAGNYSPTLQVLSDNAPEQVFLDLVYLEVKPKLLLSVSLETLLGKVSRKPGQYRLKLTNQSNLIRELAVSASSRDETELCTYTCEPSSVRLLMGETAAIDLAVRPKHKLRRPLLGRGLELPFQIDLQDLDEYPIPEQTPKGLLIWKARPWWQLLLWILVGVGTLSGFGFLVWLKFFKPAPPPVLTEFKSDSIRYVEGGRVRLAWTISNVDQLEQLTVNSVKDQVASKPQVFDFSKGLPTELSRFCQSRDRNLTCTNIDTGARLAGEYTFNLQIKAKSEQQNSQKELNVVVQPRPLPLVAGVSSSQAQIEKGKLLPLNWKLKNASQLSELQVFSQTKEGKPTLIKTYDFKAQIPPELSKQCKPPVNEELLCSNVKIGLPATPGPYGISLQTVSKSGQKQAPPSQPVPVEVKGKPPKILAFTLNGQSAGTNPSLFLKAGQAVTLKWQVEGDDLTVNLEPLGDVSANGSKTLKATKGLSQITLTVANKQGQSVKSAFLVQVDTPNGTTPQLDPGAPQPSEQRLEPLW